MRNVRIRQLLILLYWKVKTSSAVVEIGMGILSIPYALSEGGWCGIFLFFLLATLCLYTRILLHKCMESRPIIKTYPDIDQMAFGRKGRVITQAFVYLKLYLVVGQFFILEADNLTKLFPNLSLNILGRTLIGKQCFVCVDYICSLTNYLNEVGSLMELDSIKEAHCGTCMAYQLLVIALSRPYVIPCKGSQVSPKYHNFACFYVVFAHAGSPFLFHFEHHRLFIYVNSRIQDVWREYDCIVYHATKSPSCVRDGCCTHCHDSRGSLAFLAKQDEELPNSHIPRHNICSNGATVLGTCDGVCGFFYGHFGIDRDPMFVLLEANCGVQEKKLKPIMMIIMIGVVGTIGGTYMRVVKIVKADHSGGMG
ncbi:LOW QUALITY PROTEIN: hypothetical protein OSB04_021853 [Centaurea solstitialis]|uniref:Amino acid transporter transmembrane domain-containing protein n=1 Tax=Centaurea solstitialis TaxID=347529 RepID=A0AA38T704_9ASTR|nr:LOW QUALITY PROTEIN: hypothetical protein OSB04_021853 [Centaurea solstitialis]